MTCDEVDELLPGYALHALTAEAEREVTAHLETCDRHAEAVSLRAAAAVLNLGAEEREPPAALRSRVLDAVAAESGASEAAPAAAPIPLRRARPASAGATWMRVSMLAASLLVAAMVLWQGGAFTGEARQRIVRTEVSGVQVQVVYHRDTHQADMTLQGILPPEAGRDLQAWVLRKDQDPVPAGIVRVENLASQLTISAELHDGDSIAITDEPQGGSVSPTTIPFIIVSF